MEIIHNQYVLLKEHTRGIARNRQSSSCVQLLMECAMVAKAATECVNQAANEMAIDHPHLASMYHVLALVKLPEYIAEINEKMEKTKLESGPHVALQFVAEVVETAFHNGGCEKVVPITQRFAALSGLMPQDVKETAGKIPCLACSESGFEFEGRLDHDQAAEIAAARLKPHTWRCPF